MGKSLLAQKIKDALFIGDCGLCKIHLDAGYKSLDAHQRVQRIDNIKKRVVDQLDRCPRSLIIFDDFQWAPVELIIAFKEVGLSARPSPPCLSLCLSLWCPSHTLTLPSSFARRSPPVVNLHFSTPLKPLPTL